MLGLSYCSCALQQLGVLRSVREQLLEARMARMADVIVHHIMSERHCDVPVEAGRDTQ